MTTEFEPALEAFFGVIKTGDAAKLETLLASNPNLVQAQTEDGIGPIALAKYYGNDDIANLLIERGADLDALAAAIVGREDVIRVALVNDPDVVRRYSPDGWTLLHLAAFFGHPEIAEILVNHGADIGARSRNDQGNTPLHAALPGRHLEIVELLLAHGADVNARQEGGLTPLHEAALIGDVATARLLVERGADLDARTDKGESPLDLALERNQRDVARFLQEAGASPVLRTE